jgi:hypothetical protein
MCTLDSWNENVYNLSLSLANSLEYALMDV